MNGFDTTFKKAIKTDQSENYIPMFKSRELEQDSERPSFDPTASPITTCSEKSDCSADEKVKLRGQN